MQLAHFLQAHDVGVELLHRMAEVVDFEPARRAQALHALVDVVGRDPQRLIQPPQSRLKEADAPSGAATTRSAECGGSFSLGRAASVDAPRGRRHVVRSVGAHSLNSGSIRIASALDGEKQRSAALRQVNHW